MTADSRSSFLLTYRMTIFSIIFYFLNFVWLRLFLYVMEMLFVWLKLDKEKRKRKKRNRVMQGNWNYTDSRLTNRSNRVRCNSLVPFHRCHNDKHLSRAIPLNFSTHRFLMVELELVCQLLLAYSLSI